MKSFGLGQKLPQLFVSLKKNGGRTAAPAARRRLLPPPKKIFIAFLAELGNLESFETMLFFSII